ncbi:MAG: class I SAM-dependent methyltransferase [Deltaproteobacteria bacterium]|jgi:hypothetical protein|nr:class I SAM-dependent methyltransferase [Deltaproteobacteria bacterium]
MLLGSDVLDSIGLRHGTDKSSGQGRHDYLRKYEFFLRPFRDTEFTLLELGVYKGASLRTWSEYFAKADIVGVDIEPQSTEFDAGRARIVIGDLSKTDFLESLAPLNPKIVIDDASHWWPDQLRALFALYPGLAPGSIYVLEDVDTSFEPLARYFSAGLDVPPFSLLLKIAEYMTGDGRPNPVTGDGPLVPIGRAEWFDREIGQLAAMTDALVFLEGSCLLVKK